MKAEFYVDGLPVTYFDVETPPALMEIYDFHQEGDYDECYICVIECDLSQEQADDLMVENYATILISGSLYNIVSWNLNTDLSKLILMLFDN